MIRETITILVVLLFATTSVQSQHCVSCVSGYTLQSGGICNEITSCVAAKTWSTTGNAPCTACKLCPARQTVKKACTVTSDTVCGDIVYVWCPWSQWGQCDVTCGQGTHSRTRVCSCPSPPGEGTPCLENATQQETHQCSQHACPPPLCVDWSDWKYVGVCQGTCTRRRLCDRPIGCIGEYCVGCSEEKLH